MFKVATQTSIFRPETGISIFRPADGRVQEKPILLYADLHRTCLKFDSRNMRCESPTGPGRVYFGGTRTPMIRPDIRGPPRLYNEATLF